MDAVCRQIVAALTARGETVAVAESLTAGLVCSALADVPGASVVFRGGVIAYATALKSALLGVDRGVLQETGASAPGRAGGSQPREWPGLDRTIAAYRQGRCSSQWFHPTVLRSWSTSR